MKNDLKFRFYAELPLDLKITKKTFTRKYLNQIAAAGKHNNCIAIALDNKLKPVKDRRPYYLTRPNEEYFLAYVSINNQPNSATIFDAVSKTYIQKRCVRISKKLAFELHPCLF